MSDGLRRVRAQIDLPSGVAAWVLGAHAFTLSMPVVLMVVLWDRRDQLSSALDRPALVLVSAALLLVGSAFEIAQNTEDRWYYTGPYPAFSDLLFTAGITAGLGVLAVAAVAAWWTVTLAVVALAVVVVLYSSGQPGFPGMGVAGATAAAALYAALDHPGVLLLLVATGFGNAYFLDLVTSTKAQSMHGAIAASNGLGTLVIVWVLVDEAAGRTAALLPVLIASAVIVGLLGLARPWLTRRAPTAVPDRPRTHI